MYQICSRRVEAQTRITLGAIVLLILFLIPKVSLSADPEIVIAGPGQNVTLWKGFNVSGHVHIKIDGGDGTDCATLWWIVYGVNSDLGKFCDTATIPYHLTLTYGELRAGNFTRKTAISISGTASVAYSQELCGEIINCK